MQKTTQNFFEMCRLSKQTIDSIGSYTYAEPSTEEKPKDRKEKGAGKRRTKGAKA